MNFEVEDSDVLVIILAARESLPGELEPLGRQVVNFDSIIDVLVDVINCGGLPREDTSGKFGYVLLDADVCHFFVFCSEKICGKFYSETRSIYVLGDAGVK